MVYLAKAPRPYLSGSMPRPMCVSSLSGNLYVYKKIYVHVCFYEYGLSMSTIKLRDYVVHMGAVLTCVEVVGGTLAVQ